MAAPPGELGIPHIHRLTARMQLIQRLDLRIKEVDVRIKKREGRIKEVREKIQDLRGKIEIKEGSEIGEGSEGQLPPAAGTAGTAEGRLRRDQLWLLRRWENEERLYVQEMQLYVQQREGYVQDKTASEATLRQLRLEMQVEGERCGAAGACCFPARGAVTCGGWVQMCG